MGNLFLQGGPIEALILLAVCVFFPSPFPLLFTDDYWESAFLRMQQGFDFLCSSFLVHYFWKSGGEDAASLEIGFEVLWVF